MAETKSVSKFSENLLNNIIQEHALGSDTSIINNLYDIQKRRNEEQNNNYLGNLDRYFSNTPSNGNESRVRTNAGASHITDLGDGSFAIMWRDTQPNSEENIAKGLHSSRNVYPNLTIFRPKGEMQKEFTSKLVNLFKTRPVNFSLGKNGIWSILRPQDKVKYRPGSEFMTKIKDTDESFYNKITEKGFMDSFFTQENYKGFAKNKKYTLAQSIGNAVPHAVLTKMMDEIDVMNKTGDFPKVDTSIKMSDLEGTFRHFDEIEKFAKENKVNNKLASDKYWSKYREAKEDWKLEQLDKIAPQLIDYLKNEWGADTRRKSYLKIFSGKDEEGNKDVSISHEKYRQDTILETERILRLISDNYGGYMPKVNEIEGLKYIKKEPLLKVRTQKNMLGDVDASGKKIAHRDLKFYDFYKNTDRMFGVRDAVRIANENLNDQAHQQMLLDMNTGSMGYFAKTYKPSLIKISHAANKISPNIIEDTGIKYDDIFKLGIEALDTAYRNSPDKTGEDILKHLGNYFNPLELKMAKEGDDVAVNNTLSSHLNKILFEGTVKTIVPDFLKLPYKIFETTPEKLSKEQKKERKQMDIKYGGLYQNTLITNDDILHRYRTLALGKNIEDDLKKQGVTDTSTVHIGRKYLERLAAGQSKESMGHKIDLNTAQSTGLTADLIEQYLGIYRKIKKGDKM